MANILDAGGDEKQEFFYVFFNGLTSIFLTLKFSILAVKKKKEICPSQQGGEGGGS